jgi:hypothetical protein
MKAMLKYVALGAVATGRLLVVPNTVVAAEAEASSKPLVQLALLLDTSGSMQGLIEQAKGQLWRIVNEFIHARQNGQRPEVQVALFEYGKSSLPKSKGYLRLIQPLGTDLDKLSEDLFALRTNGGEEYCGWVIKEAVETLSWSKSPEVYKAIFIAGNEPFTQGPVDYAESCRAAIAKGVIVNTIHCGQGGVGISTKWQDGALRADGNYMVIDPNRAVAHFEAPQDTEIARLSAELSKTYVAYGAAGLASAERQKQQDANALALAPAGAVVQRAVTKSSSNYRNEQWDLVDALKEKASVLSEVKETDLPAEMKAMNEAERQAYIEQKSKERAEIQAGIQVLNAERNRYVAEHQRNSAANNTLDAAMVSAIREQAQAKGFRFDHSNE